MMQVTSKQFYKIALLAGAATMLQGCVAAVIPLAAGGLMGGAGNFDGSNSREDVAASDIDATVIVNPSDTEASLVAEASASQPAPIPTPPPTPSPAAASAVTTASTEDSASDEFSAAFNDAPEAAPAAAAAAVANQVSASDTARLVVVPEEDNPASVSAAPSPITEPTVRQIVVDSQTALADSNVQAPNVSAAQAAAALANVAPTAQIPAPVPAPATQAQAAASAPAVVSSAVSSDGERAAELAANRATSAQTSSANTAQSSFASPSATPAPTSPLSDASAITSLISFANQRKFEFTPGQARESAMLVDRIKLSADRADCIGIQPTVLIDLDPEGGTFSPINAARPPAGLATGLSRLRAAGVAIAWISSGSSTYSEIYRDSLARSGLDESGADQLLLMRGPDDRKQIRREQLAQLSCLIAIAGDARSDFDELYDYLLNPGDAAVLEPLIGEGWFIIPTPLLSEGPTR